MKRPLFALTCFVLTLSGCQGWTVQPIPYIPATPPPTPTPLIYTATAIILPPPATQTSTAAGIPASLSDAPTSEAGETATSTRASPTSTQSVTPSPTIKLQLDIKECNTSIDITHAMGEVTNAYVTIRNLGSVDAQNVCATLNGLDEARPHPDKSKCLAVLPSQHEVALKLTVDTTHGENTAIQVDLASNGILAQRAGKASCSDIELLPSDMGPLGQIEPIP